MNVDVLKYHQELNYQKYDEFNVVSSKRQALQNGNNVKSLDTTIIYKSDRNNS